MNMNINHLLYRTRFRLRRWLPVGTFPVHVDIELAGRCNLACVMCPYGTGGFDESMQGMMSQDMAREAVWQAAEGGASSIKFNFRGEPGMSPLLIEMVQMAKDLGITEVAINTNLLAFSMRRLKQLASSGIDLIIISIDGATAATYEAIRVKGDFAKLMQNLTLLYHCEPRPRIRIQSVLQEANRHEAQLMRETFAPLCDEFSLRRVADRGQGEGFTAERKDCAQPRQRLIVAWDGKVFGCCSNWNNENPVGEFPKQRLAEIWRSGAMENLRHLAKDPNRGNPCRNCTVSDSYK